MRQPARRWLRWLAFVVAYILLAKASEGTTLENGFSPWYPPAGLTLAFLMVEGPALFPVALAARWLNTWVVFPDAWRDDPDGVIARGLLVVGTYTAAAWVLRRLDLRRARLRELGWFATVGVVAAPLLASFAVAIVAIVLEGSTSTDAFDAAWTFWVGDAVAIATIVPAVLVVVAAAAGRVHPPRIPSSRGARGEIVLQSVALIVAPVLAVALANDSGPVGFFALALAPVIWIATRQDIVLVAVGLLVVNTSLSVVAALVLGASTEMSEVQVVMLSCALAGLYIAAAIRTRDQMTADLLESDERYRSLLESAPDLVLRFDGRARCVAYSKPPMLQEIGNLDVVLVALERAWPGSGRAVLLDGQARTTDLTVHGRDGRRHLVARLSAVRAVDGRIEGVMAVVTDVTDLRRAVEMLDHVRGHDPLTGAANRSWFLAGLDELCSEGGRVSLVLLDLDGFTAVNELFGGDRGDAVLQEVADRLRRVVGGHALVGRLGADQFAVASRTDEVMSSVLGQELVDALRIRVADPDHVVLLTASGGMAVSDRPDARDLIRLAENSLHAAKEAGRDRVVIVSDADAEGPMDRAGTLAHLRRCLAARELVVHHQPIVDLVTGAVIGIEALVRLPAPEGDGLLLPPTFLALTEEAGLDVELGTIVLDRAVADLAAVRGEGGAPLRVNVNVTARQLTQPSFADEVVATCARHGVSPGDVCLELTETLVMADPDAAIATLHELRRAGIQTALDDFGVGYSSIHYLQQLPIDVLKLDKVFVDGLPDDRDSRSIVSLVVGLAEAVGVSVTAEGIERPEQRDVLLELGCRTGQGFLFGRPGPLDALPLGTVPSAWS